MPARSPHEHVADRDDMVVKALSWALRELAKRDPAAARQFLDAHGGQLAARVRREVESKLTTGLKTPRARPSPAPGAPDRLAAPLRRP